MIESRMKNIFWPRSSVQLKLERMKYMVFFDETWMKLVSFLILIDLPLFKATRLYDAEVPFPFFLGWNLNNKIR